MLNNLRLALRFLWRELRAGEWFIIFFSLILAISATTSIHFYIDRVTRGLDIQSTKLLGGDLVVTSSLPIPIIWIQKAENLHLRTAEVWSYPTMASSNTGLQLVNLQAVSKNYPLVGNQHIQPHSHAVWVEERVLPALNLHLNQDLTIGTAKFRIEKLLTSDMDALNTGFLISPRVLMRLDDVASTQTVIPGSRVDYRLLLTGNKEELKLFRQWIAPQLTTGQRIIDITNQDFALRNILKHAENYLQLILLTCLLLCGVAIALSVQQFLRRHYAHVALWRCLGASQSQIKQIFILQLLLIALLASTIAVSIGYFSQLIFAHLFESFLKFPLPQAGVAPIVLGFVTSIFLLFIFAFPVINQLPLTSPLYIWRSDIRKNTWTHFVFLVVAFLMLSLSIYALTNMGLLILYFLSGLFICIGFLYGISILLLNILRLASNSINGVIRRGISQLTQHANSVSLQFIGFSLILTSILLLAFIRLSLLENWKQALPRNTPNYFAFNISPNDLTPIQQFFKEGTIHIENIYPMVRGRLAFLNDKPILDAVPTTALENNALHRELNLSWMQTFPSDNKIVYGKQWQETDKGKAFVSVEKKLASDLHLKLGDKLTFQLGDQRISATIINFRSLEWSSFHPNFFMIFPPGLLNNLPMTYITSFHLAADQTNALNELVQRFPNITIIDVASLLLQMQDLLNKITLAMQYVFFFALGAGILIFLASLQASMDERKQTYSLLRTLGASKKYIYQSILAEFGLLFFIVISISLALSFILAKIIEYALFTT